MRHDPGIVLPWLFLAVSIWGALFTANALRPLRGGALAVGLSFFPAWLTTELALHHILWQAVATAGFVYFGAMAHVVGWVGMGTTLISWLGLGWLFLNAHLDGRVVQDALEEALGPAFRDEIDHAHALHMRKGIDWRRVIFPFWMTNRSVERLRDLAYVDDDNPRHRLDVYRRRDLEPGAPVLLQIHGGAWMIGEKGQQGLPLMNHMAARGWLCVAINYGLSPKATWPAHLVDCKLALKWIRENVGGYGGDPDFVVVTGGSAGGHLAAMVALTAEEKEFQPGFEQTDTRVQAFIPFYGVFDWTDRFGYRGESDSMKERLERHIIKLPRHEAESVYHRASPMSHVGSCEVPPAMVLHGRQDTLAPAAEAAHFVALLREHSDEPVVHAEFSGAHHAFEVFPSVRALHAIHGVEAFAAWVASTHPKRESKSARGAPRTDLPRAR
jgi:acetyl esterase/lipase